jgi:adenylylsulfate kinase
MNKNTNIVWQKSKLTRAQREEKNQAKSGVIWLTGLSGAGKSTLAYALEQKLFELGFSCYVLDGDNVRHGLCADLGFSMEDRTENIRRVGEVAKLFVDAGIIVITAFISPFRSDRDGVRAMMQAGDFVEVFCDCPLNVCEQRDVKGLYKKARSGDVKEFTGISSPYEAPLNPELILKTDQSDISSDVDLMIEILKKQKFI